jgi:hypothetical protein
LSLFSKFSLPYSPKYFKDAMALKEDFDKDREKMM